MRYVTFSFPSDSAERLGVVADGAVLDVMNEVGANWPGTCPDSVLALIQAGPEAWRRLADAIGLVDGGRARHPLDRVRIHAPIPRPRKNVFCLGLNYVSHMQESSRARERQPKIPEAPVFFTKAPTSVTGPFDAIPLDTAVTQQLDYEAELGVIIGVAGKNISRGKALEHVFGYTIINDISARDVQLKHMQWFKGKSLDGCCPMGPAVVTADEFGDPQRKQLSLRVNGIGKQNGTTGDMIFPVDVIIESLSQGMTIEPGDIIATGTPEGVGLGRTPPEYLNDGDLVETEIEGIGTMRNRIAASTN
jgi:2-keto-4-pentenoate hydratase/2-oxohepta-3-ene-1,7-dioic acid hydratase in catechol pathway